VLKNQSTALMKLSLGECETLSLVHIGCGR